MLVFGAIDFAAAVAKVGSFLGYHVTVCDARPVFATNSRFPGADEVVVDWPHRYLAAELEGGRIDRRTVLAVLTHDPKFDVPLLEVALRLDDDVRPGYIGAMGSRRTHDERMERLVEAGLSGDEIALLSSPIGLDLGARTPGGDGRVDRGGDRGPPVGRVGGAARRDRGPHPPRRLTRVRPAADWLGERTSPRVDRMFLATPPPPHPRPPFRCDPRDRAAGRRHDAGRRALAGA